MRRGLLVDAIDACLGALVPWYGDAIDDAKRTAERDAPPPELEARLCALDLVALAAVWDEEVTDREWKRVSAAARALLLSKGAPAERADDAILRWTRFRASRSEQALKRRLRELSEKLTPALRREALAQVERVLTADGAAEVRAATNSPYRSAARGAAPPDGRALIELFRRALAHDGAPKR